MFIWTNGDELNVTNWSANGEPSSSKYADEEACTFLTPGDGWKVASCEDRGNIQGGILPLCEKAVKSGKLL